MNDLISIIIPVYNASKYLNRCIDSILNQTYKNLEIILVDDESSDNSLEICNKYKKIDERIKVFSKNNSGPSDTRKYGFNHSNGNLIMFLDSDDYLEHDACEYLLNLKNKNKVSLVCCDYYINNNPKNEIEKISVIEKKDILKDYFSNSNIKNCVWNKLYDRNIIKDDFFATDLNYAEDVLFVIQVLCLCDKICVSNKCKVHYYIENNSLSRSKISLKKIEDIFKSHNRQIEIINNFKCDNYIKNKSVEKMYNALIELYNMSIIDESKENRKNVLRYIKQILEKYSINNDINSNIRKKIIFITKYNFIYNILFFIKKNKFYSFIYLLTFIGFLSFLIFPFFYKYYDSKEKNKLLNLGLNYLNNNSKKNNFDKILADNNNFLAYKDGYCLIKFENKKFEINSLPINKCSFDNASFMKFKNSDNIIIDDVNNPTLYNYVLIGKLSNDDDLKKYDAIISYEDLDLKQKIKMNYSKEIMKDFSFEQVEPLRGFNGVYDNFNYLSSEITRKIGKIEFNVGDKIDLSYDDNQYKVIIHRNDEIISYDLAVGDKLNRSFEGITPRKFYLYYKLPKEKKEKYDGEKLVLENGLNIELDGYSSMYLFYYDKD